MGITARLASSSEALFSSYKKRIMWVGNVFGKGNNVSAKVRSEGQAIIFVRSIITKMNLILLFTRFCCLSYPHFGFVDSSSNTALKPLILCLY
jgi:hypothetical protein